jgi:DNA-3-methyladenine glycosylase II
MHYFAHLQKDKKLARVLEGQSPHQLKIYKNVSLRLMHSIMSQQLSVKVARVFQQRFLDLYDGEPHPQQVLDTPFDVLRGIGLSNAKAMYIQNIARFSIEQGMALKELKKMSDEEVIAYLTQIKGVGRWTVEMLLMFTLGREDVFAVDDLGIQQAMTKLYKLDAADKKAMKAKMLKLSARWAPYRTYACLHLWGWKDNQP